MGNRLFITQLLNYVIIKMINIVNILTHETFLIFYTMLCVLAPLSGLYPNFLKQLLFLARPHLIIKSKRFFLCFFLNR